MKIIEKYLNIYSTRFEGELIEGLSSLSFHEGVALPLFGEDVSHVRESLACLRGAAEAAQKKAIAALVINQRRNAKPEYKEKNQILLKDFEADEKPFQIIQDPFLTIVILNWTSPHLEFNEKEGVGLARKIGCDFLTLLTHKKILKTKWLSTTDADSRVALDYFADENESDDENIPLKLMPYKHVFEHENGAPLLDYDLWLRYYTLALRKTGSPFAFSCLGSTLKISPLAYAKVRGFPNRLAAEDFHLASKLSKIGSVYHSKLSALTLIDRASDRVPFGTGVGTAKIRNASKENERLKFIHPDCFHLLERFENECRDILGSDTFRLPDIPPCIEKELKLTSLVKTAYETRTSFKNRMLHFYSTFDALKTLRFIHVAEKHISPSIDYEEALRQLNPRYDFKHFSKEEVSANMAQDEYTSSPLGLGDFLFGSSGNQFYQKRTREQNRPGHLNP